MKLSSKRFNRLEYSLSNGLKNWFVNWLNYFLYDTNAILRIKESCSCKQNAPPLDCELAFQSKCSLYRSVWIPLELSLPMIEVRLRTYPLSDRPGGLRLCSEAGSNRLVFSMDQGLGVILQRYPKGMCILSLRILRAVIGCRLPRLLALWMPWSSSRGEVVLWTSITILSDMSILIWTDLTIKIDWFWWKFNAFHENWPKIHQFWWSNQFRSELTCWTNS